MQRSNGGGWAQGVCRGQSSNREAHGFCEATRRIDAEQATSERGEEKKREVEKKKQEDIYIIASHKTFVYGLDLLVKVCFVFIVLALEVPGLLR